MKRSIKSSTVCLMAISTMFISTACSNYKDTTTDKVEVQRYVDSVEDLMNLRYYGLDEKIVDKSLLSDEDKNKIKSKLALPEENDITDRGVFISLEEEFSIREFEDYTLQGDVGTSDIVSVNKDAITDLKITERNGERGIYTNDVYVDEEGQFKTMIYGDEIWVDVPKEVINQKMIGTPEYKFKVVDYQYYDGGNLIVKLRSDIEGAFDEVYKNVEIVETLGVDASQRMNDGTLEFKDKDKVYKMTQEEYDNHLNSFYEFSNSITATLDMKLDIKKGIISQIDTSYITDALLYK